MKLYFKAIVFIAFIILEFGVFAPKMISERDTISVLVGVFSILLVIPVLYFIGIKIYKDLKEKLDV